jgi:hypothetical protein
MAALAGAAQLGYGKFLRTVQLRMASHVCARVYSCRLPVHALRAFCPGAQVMDQSALERKPSLLEPTRSQNYAANDFSFRYSQKRFSQASFLISTKYFQNRIIMFSLKLFYSVQCQMQPLSCRHIGNTIFPNGIMKFQ